MIVLNVLGAMRFDPPSPSFVDALMVHLLDVVGAPEDEPQRTWFKVPGRHEVGAQDAQFSNQRANPASPSPRRMPGSIDAPYAVTMDPGVRRDEGRFGDVQVQLRLWSLRIRRTLRRHVGLDLPAFIQRPAWVSATATHIDVVYPMSDIDLRLRRRGLDADPGWVPWFGRIVTFHFIDDDLLPPHEAEHG